MPFLQLTFDCGKLDAEAVESSCFEAGALSVTLTDAADTPILEPPLATTPLWPQVRMAALFNADADRARILDTLRQSLGAVPQNHVFEIIADRAWERECLADLQPLRFGRRLWVVPQGREVRADDTVVVRLDPGLAFGTGTHPTTALCLEWLDGANLEDAEVIDYGCGSGILGVAAIKLGARRVFAVDHDPQALIATRENAERNGVLSQMEISQSDSRLPAIDIILANILAQPLIEFAPRFQEWVKPRGDIVLSGILADQADAVAAAYTQWFDMDDRTEREQWVRLHGVRR